MDDRTTVHPAPDNTSDTPIVKGTVQARQGVTGHNVRYVLLISLGAAVLILAVVWLAFVP
jgi:hypothetical protein